MTAAVHLVPDPAPRTGATVTPHHRPLTSPPSLGRLITASVILGAPSAIAIWGSATGLTVIAAEDHVASPWTLPACLDVLALGVVIVAMMFPHVASRWTWKAAPWACYGASLVLQVSDAWEHGVRAWGTHAAGLVAAAVGSHFILDLWEARAHAPADRIEADVEPTEAAPAVELERPAPAALTSISPVVRPAPARKATKVRAKAGPEIDADVLAKVRTALDEMGVAAIDTTRDDVLTHMRKSGPAPHANKVGPAFRHLKENP